MYSLSIEVNHLFWYDASESGAGYSESLKGVFLMTNMKRTTISLPDELADRIFALRKDDRFIRCSYSEIIRQLAEKGLSILDEEQGKKGA